MRPITFAALTCLALLTGCGKSPCNQWCDWQQQCLNSNLDVSSCTSSCESNDANSADHQSRSQACANCLGGKTCAEASSSCASLCILL